jgi:opacity protein-like surface antigen
VLAQEGIYVGIGLGNFDYAEDAAFLAPEPFEDTVATWKVYGGFEFGEHFGFEIRYGATDEIEQTATGTDAFFGEYSAAFDTDFTITTVLAMGMLPNDWGTLFGGIGYYDITANADLALSTECCGTINDETSLGDNGLATVLGIEWRFERFGTGVGVRLEYEWLDVDGDASAIGVGIAYRF